MITVQDLTKEVMSQVELYKTMLIEGIEEVYDDIAVEGLKEIKAESKTAGFNDKNYSNGWAKVVRKNRVTGTYGVTLYNKKHYRLTHLLEKGHATRNGGRTTAYPHIAPTQDKMDKEIVKKLKEKIESI